MRSGRGTKWRELFWFEARVFSPEPWIVLGISLILFATSIVGTVSKLHAAHAAGDPLIEPLTTLSGVVTVIGLGGLVWSGWRMFLDLFRRESLKVEASKAVKGLWQTLATDGSLEDCGGVVVPVPGSRDAIVRSRELDRYLRSDGGKDIVVSVRPDHLEAMRDLVRVDPVRTKRMLRAKFRASRDDKKKLFFDEAKISLLTDLKPGIREVEIGRSSYFLSFLTNELAVVDFKTTHEGVATLYSAASERFRTTVIDSSTKPPRLRPLSAGRLSNHIGGNVIAITKNGEMRLWQQLKESERSGGKIAPTGSGSLDWEDLPDFIRDERVAERKARSDSNRTMPQLSLLDLIKEGMERECIEESTARKGKVLRSKILATKVLGYYRWVGAAGLPGFLGVCRIGVILADLKPNEEETEDADWLPLIKDARDLGSLQKSIGELLGESAHDLSVPLFANLIALKEALEEDPAGMSAFLWGKIES